MELTKMIGLSTACISVKTAGILNESAFRRAEAYNGLVAYEKGLYGWIVHVPTSMISKNLPEDLKCCLEYANSKECEWIMFDRDIEYDEKDGLKKYSW